MRDYVEKKLLVLFYGLLIFLPACLNDEPGHPVERNNADFYFDYIVRRYFGGSRFGRDETLPRPPF